MTVVKYAALIGVVLSMGTAAPAMAQNQPAKSAVEGASTYQINPGDEIEVYVWGDERLQRALKVLPDGTFSFPLVGTVRAAGRTVNEVEKEVTARLAEQYRNAPPQVTVSVRAPSGMQISVLGKVRAPGIFSPVRPLNLLQALSLAGGGTEFADLGSVIIMRQEGTKNTLIRARLNDALKGRPSSQDLESGGIPMLKSGDVVIVP